MEQIAAAQLDVSLELALTHSQCDHHPSSQVLHMQDVYSAENGPNVLLCGIDGYGIVLVKVSEMMPWMAGKRPRSEDPLSRRTCAAVRLEFDLRMLHLGRHDGGSERGSTNVSIPHFTMRTQNAYSEIPPSNCVVRFGDVRGICGVRTPRNILLAFVLQMLPI